MTKKNNLWTYYGIILLALLFMLIAPFRDIFVYSIFIYYIARPLNRSFMRITKSGTFSAILSLIIIIIPILITTTYTLEIAAFELKNYAETIPEDQKSSLLDMIIEQIDTGYPDILQSLFVLGQDKELMASAIGMLSQSMNYFFTFLGFIFNIFLLFMISFYLIRDGKNLRKILEYTIFDNSLIAKKYFKKTDDALYRIFYGNILNAIITAILAMIIYTTFNTFAPEHLSLPYPILLAILTGIASLIPMVGVKLIWIPATLYLIINSFINATLVQDMIPLAAFLIAVNLIIDMLPDFALRPLVTAKGMHTGVMMLSYIFGPIVFGISGIFIGPIIVVLITNYVTIILPALKNKR